MEIVLWIFVGFLGGIFVSALINVGRKRIDGNESDYKPYKQIITTGYWSVADDKQDCTTDYTKYIDNSVIDTTIDKNFSHKGG